MTDPKDSHVRLLAALHGLTPASMAAMLASSSQINLARRYAILRAAVPAEAINLEALNHGQV